MLHDSFSALLMIDSFVSHFLKVRKLYKLKTEERVRNVKYG